MQFRSNIMAMASNTRLYSSECEKFSPVLKRMRLMIKTNCKGFTSFIRTKGNYHASGCASSLPLARNRLVKPLRAFIFHKVLTKPGFQFKGKAINQYYYNYLQLAYGIACSICQTQSQTSDNILCIHYWSDCYVLSYRHLS